MRLHLAVTARLPGTFEQLENSASVARHLDSSKTCFASPEAGSEPQIASSVAMALPLELLLEPELAQQLVGLASQEALPMLIPAELMTWVVAIPSEHRLLDSELVLLVLPGCLPSQAVVQA